MFYRIITPQKRKRLVQEITRDDYRSHVPDDLVASAEGLATSSQQSSQSLARHRSQTLSTSSTGTQSMQSIGSVGSNRQRGSKRSLASDQSMTSQSSLLLPAEEIEEQYKIMEASGGTSEGYAQGETSGVAQEPVEPSDVFTFEHETAAMQQRAGDTEATEDDPFKVPRQPASTYTVETRSKTHRKKQTVANKFRKNLELQKQARQMEVKPAENLGQSIIQGHQELSAEQDYERQQW